MNSKNLHKKYLISNVTYKNDKKGLLNREKTPKIISRLKFTKRDIKFFICNIKVCIPKKFRVSSLISKKFDFQNSEQI